MTPFPSVSRGALLALLCLCGGAGSAADPAPRAPVRAAPASFAPAFERASAWAVGLYLFVPGEEEPRVGAGFLVDDRGSVATAAHLLAEGAQVVVALADRRLLAAQQVGHDPETDIALLRIDPPPRVHPVLAAPGQLRVGDWVVAIGEPFGLEHSLSAGVVSGLRRHFGDDGALAFIQSDVALNPGNSGGPLLDASGAIVGMNVRTIVGPAGTPGASLAVPIDIVQQVLTELRTAGEVPPRPRLGAHFDDVPPLAAWSAGQAQVRGALILDVERGSLAERIGLRHGDVVLEMNGRTIADGADLVAALLAWRTALPTRWIIRRAGHEYTLARD